MTDLGSFAREAYLELLTRGNLAALDRYLAGDVVMHGLPPGLPAGIDGARMYFSALLGAFPDIRCDVLDTVVQDDRIGALVACRATHTGEFRGIPATGRSVRWTGESHWRVVGGKLAELWHHYDHLSLLEQLGADLTPVAGGDLVEIWDRHVHAEFVLRDPDATLATMTDEPSVSCLPAGTGGAGRSEVYRFYAEQFIPTIPADFTAGTVSRTVGHNRLVEESVATFTHDRTMPWFLPGIAPTGRRLEVPTTAVVEFTGGRVAAERLYWDQAGVLRQLDLLPADIAVLARL
jgi:carboxymethylenebutenolidase